MQTYCEHSLQILSKYCKYLSCDYRRPWPFEKRMHQRQRWLVELCLHHNTCRVVATWRCKCVQQNTHHMYIYIYILLFFCMYILYIIYIYIYIYCILYILYIYCNIYILYSKNDMFLEYIQILHMILSKNGESPKPWVSTFNQKWSNDLNDLGYPRF